MIIIILILTFCSLVTPTSFTLSDATVSPSTAKSNALYSFQFNTVSSFTQDFDLNIRFPTSQYEILAVSNCQLLINDINKTSAVCSAISTEEITFTNLNIAQSINNMTVSFQTTTAEYAGTATVIFTYYDPISNAKISGMDNYISITTTNADMTLSFSSTSDIVGENVTYTLEYQPSVTISANSVVQIQIQPWGAFKQSNFNTNNVTSICGDNCTLTVPSDTGNVSQVLRYANLYSTTSTDSKTLVFSQAKNPPSTAPIQVIVTILQMLSASSFKSYMTGTITFSINTPNEFGFLNFAPSDATISANNIVTLRLGATNPISSSSYLRIDSSILDLSYQFHQYNQGTQPLQATTTDGTLLLGDLTASTTSSPTFLTLRNFTLTNPPYANKPVTLTFTSENLVDTTYYLIDRYTLSITSEISAITQASVSAANTSINSVTTYSLWFVTVNLLIKNSFIIVQFPSTINIQSASCSIDGIASTCIINNSTHLTATLNTIILANNNISITITSVNHPSTTTTTDSLSITTYYEDIDSIVDQITSGITVTATSVPLKAVTLTPASYIVRDITNYTLEVQIDNPLPAASTMKVQISTTSHADRTIVLHQFSVDGTPISTCTSFTLLATLYIQFGTECFPSQVAGSSTISIIFGNISNPTSTKPSETWAVETLYNSLQMEYLLSGITTTMTTPSDIFDFSATPASLIANSQNTYTFKFNSQNQYYSGNRIVITFPDGVLIGGGFLCSAVSTDLTVSCETSNSQTLEVTMSLASTQTSVQFTVTSITNNWFAGTRTFSMQTTTNDTTYYYKETGSSIVNFQSASLTASAANDQNIILLDQSTIKVTLTSPFTLTRASDTSLLSITMIVPSDLTPLDNTCTLSYPSSVCSLNSQTFTITNFDDFTSSIVITFDANTTYFTQTGAFSLKLTYVNSIVATNTVLTVLSYCTTPCMQCTSTQTQCLSCLPHPYSQNNTYFPDNSSCVVTCPSTYYLSAPQCNQCNSTACYECETTANTCTSCQNTKNLYENTCLSVCPDTFYALNNECLSCNSPCNTCTSSTYCLSCITNYNLDLDNSCVVTCSDSAYLGVNGVCQLCTNNCKTCQGTLSNCTSCDDTQYILLDNQCIQACPSGYYNNINTTCEVCDSLCATCISLTQCTTCISLHYLYNGDTCTDTCPPGTITIVNTCVDCDAECATCEGVVGNCTSCVSGYLFYLNQCLTDCPTLTYPYNGQCTTCIDPCVTCDSSPNLCLSCTSGLYLLNNSCLTSCPGSEYYVSGSQCVACIDNCLTCSSSVVCDVCSDGFYLLDGGCYSQCPSNYPIIENRQCKDCSEECAECEGSPDNCTSCTVFYFKYSYTCVLQCPLAYYSNVVTYECESGLSSKIVFFPVLITAVVITFIAIISKCISKSTALITALVALFSYLQLAIWIYVIVLLGAQYKQPDVDYVLPTIMIAIGLGSLLVVNITFFYFNGKRVQSDQLAQQWASNNVNFWSIRVIRIFALLFHKFYRLVYSRLFNALPLSLVYKNRSNVFTIATIYTVVSLVTSQIPLMIGCWSLVYNKLLKDQMFYTCIEALIITAVAIILSLIDVYKSEDFFEESEFLKMKRFVEQVKDSSFHKLEEKFDISQEEGSVEGQRYVGLTGGKFMFSKQDPSTFKDLYFQERESEITDAIESNEKKKVSKMINIFESIKEEDAEYYQLQKHDQKQVFTESEKLNLQNKLRQKSLQSDEEGDLSNANERKAQFGLDDPFDDKMSLISERSRKKRWNNMMTKRKQLSNKIFNNHPLNLQKIEEPDHEDDDENEGSQIEDKEQSKMRRRRKKKRGKTNKELQKIYLERLTEKKKKAKDTIVINKQEKYDF